MLQQQQGGLTVLQLSAECCSQRNRTFHDGSATVT
jgi:hypothetical protein